MLHPAAAALVSSPGPGPETPRVAKHIGIVAVSPEGSALCYREIFRYATRLMGEHGHPTVTIHNEPLEQYVEAVLKDDWHTVGELLAKSARILATAGANFCIVPDNLMQHGVHLAESLSPITMTELVAERIAHDGRRAVGLIGAKMVMYGSTYQTHLGLKGIKVLIPDESEADVVDGIIFRELIYGVVRGESERNLIGVINHLRTAGCEGIILGCSEAPLLISEENSPLPIYDPTALLAEGAIRCCLGQRPLRPASASFGNGGADGGI
jgi:aspartate racemase